MAASVIMDPLRPIILLFFRDKNPPPRTVPLYQKSSAKPFRTAVHPRLFLNSLSDAGINKYGPSELSLRCTDSAQILLFSSCALTMKPQNKLERTKSFLFGSFHVNLNEIHHSQQFCLCIFCQQ